MYLLPSIEFSPRSGSAYKLQRGSAKGAGAPRHCGKKTYRRFDTILENHNVACIHRRAPRISITLLANFSENCPCKDQQLPVTSQEALENGLVLVRRAVAYALTSALALQLCGSKHCDETATSTLVTQTGINALPGAATRRRMRKEIKLNRYAPTHLQDE
jgi:hypothetical protein